MNRCVVSSPRLPNEMIYSESLRQEQGQPKKYTNRLDELVHMENEREEEMRVEKKGGCGLAE